jgi:uncharacterized membrane protein
MNLTPFIILSFIASFKAILIEGSEVTIIALTTFQKVGKKNVIAGVSLGVLVTAALFVFLSKIFSLFPQDYVSILAGVILLYFSYRFGRGFYRYYFKGGNFEKKMEKEEKEIIEKSISDQLKGVSITPIFLATLVEGTEATLIIAASGVYSPTYAIFGALLGIAILLIIAIVSYKYLIKMPRWTLDLIAFGVLLIFGIIFITSGILGIYGIGGM